MWFLYTCSKCAFREAEAQLQHLKQYAYWGGGGKSVLFNSQKPRSGERCVSR